MPGGSLETPESAQDITGRSPVVSPQEEPPAPALPPARAAIPEAGIHAGEARAFIGEAPRRKRVVVAREWPPEGTKLSAEYLGVRYHAEIVAAKRRLKSGRQIRLLDGPAAGKRLNSFSRAMLLATKRQRREHKLGRKGVSNGWAFWRPVAAAGTP
jgi:hypothetical protein